MEEGFNHGFFATLCVRCVKILRRGRRVIFVERGYFPLRLLYAAYAIFLRLILSFNRSFNDVAVSCNEAISSAIPAARGKLAPSS